ncbi:MAG: porin family protein [Tatlockia sp.]|nr:porin family protein [Tatlockia sp.]
MRLKLSFVFPFSLAILASVNCQAALNTTNSGLSNNNRIETYSPTAKIVEAEQYKTAKTTVRTHRSRVFIGDKDAALAPPRSPNHFEVYGAIGIVNLKAEDSFLRVTASEVDKLVQTNDGHWGTGAQLGFGYIYFLRDTYPFPGRLEWFPAIEPQVNVNFTTISSGIRGDVLRFADSNFRDLSYKMPFSSARVMADAALTVASLNRFSVYAKGGIGTAWNTIRYEDSENFFGPTPLENLILDENSRTQFAWEAGGGLTYNFTDRVALSLEYLFANIGKIRLAATGDTGNIAVPVIVPTHFNLDTQSLLLTLRIGF